MVQNRYGRSSPLVALACSEHHSLIAHFSFHCILLITRRNNWSGNISTPLTTAHQRSVQSDFETDIAFSKINFDNPRHAAVPGFTLPPTLPLPQEKSEWLKFAICSRSREVSRNT